MRSVESSAKTMEEAVTLGLEKLGVSFSDVKIDILDEGSKGFLGFLGGKPVVVRLTVREDEEAVQMPSVTMDAPKTDRQEKRSQKASTQENGSCRQGGTEGGNHRQARPQSSQAEVAPGSAEEKARTFLADVTRLMGVEVTINVHRDDEGNVRVDMFGDTLGILIGRRGETLDALQYLTSLYVNRGQEEYTRVTLDTENYRTKREEALRRLANRMANRCVKTGRKVVMEPMNPYERRILHSALQQNDAVFKHSEGEEPNRHVVITLKQPQ